MTGLPAQPGTTYRQQFPTTDENGTWDFHCRSWLGQEAGQFQFYYQADGFDNYIRVTAQRLGPGLLVVFTDPQGEDRSPAEEERGYRRGEGDERIAVHRSSPNTLLASRCKPNADKSDRATKPMSLPRPSASRTC